MVSKKGKKASNRWCRYSPVSISKTGYKKKKPEQKLSEEHMMISHQDIPETTTTTKVEQEVVQLNPTHN